MTQTRARVLTPGVDQYVEMVTAVARGVNGKLMGAGLPLLVGERGVRYQSVPWRTWHGRGYRRGPIRRCFSNAYALADWHPELTYVEGLASTGALAVHHAWCVTEDGRVVDPTWRDTGRYSVERAPVAEWEYRGIPFTDDARWRILLAKYEDGDGTYGLLDARVVHEAFDESWLPAHG